MSKLYAAGLTLALALSGEAFSQQGVTTRMVTATGWPAPGMGAGIVFEKFGTPSTNEFGRVALRGWLDGPGTTVETEQGIWHEPTRGNLVLNIVAGQQAAGAPAGVVYLDFNRPAFNRLGTLAFNGRVTGIGVDATNDRCIWVIREGSAPELVARTGDVPAGFPPDIQFDEFGTPSGYVTIVPFLAENDTVLYKGWFRGAGVTALNETSFWHYTPQGQHEMVLRLGGQAPGFPQGIVANFLGFNGMNRLGDSIANVIVGDPITGSQDTEVIYASQGAGPLVPTVIEWESPAGEPQSVYQYLFVPDMNSSGLITFHTYLTPADGSGGFAQSSWCQEPGNGFVEVCRQGVMAPGTEPGVLYGSTFTPLICGDGSVYFRTELTGAGVTNANNRAYWLKRPGGIPVIIAREGDQVPALDPGITYQTLDASRHAVNGAGQFALVAQITGPSVTSANDSVLLMSDTSGSLRVAMREGDLLDASSLPGMPMMKAVSQFYFQENPAEIGYQSGFAEMGELFVRVVFTDATEAIVALRLVPACPADTNGDGMLSPADFSAWVAAFNAQAPDCDQNGDSSCTPADFSAWVANYNAGC